MSTSITPGVPRGLFQRSTESPGSGRKGYFIFTARPRVEGVARTKAQSQLLDFVMGSHTIDEYIDSAPSSAQAILRKIRRAVRSVAPNATEIISYQMPAFRLNGILVFFGSFKTHIGLYPPISGDAALMKQLKRYSGPKGNLRFPLDEPIPYDLIRKIVRLRVKQDLAQASTKKKSRK